jgi:hypothetical protein
MRPHQIQCGKGSAGEHALGEIEIIDKLDPIAGVDERPMQVLNLPEIITTGVRFL